MTNQTPSIVTKISVAKVCGKLKKPSEKTYIMQVFGIANGIKEGTSTYGEYQGLVGQFRAINIHTGDMFQGGECYLPNIALNLVLGALNDVNKSVEFAFNIGIYPAENAFGYEYCCDPLMAASESDPLELMQKKISALPTAVKKLKAG
jgi:hypothetical protein